MQMFSYWEGPIPDVIRACLDSIKYCCGSQWKLITPSSLPEYITTGVFHPNFNRIKNPAHRADCIRAALLFNHGGLWLDADTVMLWNPDDEFSLEKELVFSVWDKPPKRVLNGYIYAQKGSSIAGAWLLGINKALETFHPANMKWTSFGEAILTPLVDANPDKVHQIPRSTFLPIDVDSNVQALFSTDDWKTYIKTNTVAFGLNWSWMLQNQRNAMLCSPARWKNSHLLIHKLLSDAQKRINEE